MKALMFPAIIAAVVLTAVQVGHSQGPTGPQSAAQRLQAIKAKNKELIERQTATLKRLEEMQLEAQQLKFLAKRA